MNVLARHRLVALGVFLATATYAADEPSMPVPGEGLATALALEQAFIAVAERASPAVVAIRGYRRSDSGASAESADGWTVTENDRYPGHSLRTVGSGFFVSDDGYILTTRDAVQHPDDGEPVDLVAVEFGRQVWVRGRVVGIEPTINLAVVKISTPLKLAPLSFADSDNLRVGQWAIALGDPDGAERTFAIGVVSQQPQRDCYQEELTRTYVQTSIRVHPQSQGGPLVDIHGQVIGLSVPRGGTTTIKGTEVVTGAGFALPSNLITTIYEALREKESRLSPWLGFSARRREPVSISTICLIPAPQLVAVFGSATCWLNLEGSEFWPSRISSGGSIYSVSVTRWN